MYELRPEDTVRSQWIAGAITLLLGDRTPDAPPVTVQLDTGDQPIVVEARDGAIHTRLGSADDPDVTLTGPPTPILGYLLGITELADAEAAGVAFRGDPGVLDRLGPQSAPA
jgi:hypothetical protein